MLALSIVVILILAVAGLTANAIRLNRVPVFEPPGAAARLGVYLTRNAVETRSDHPFPELRTRVYPASPVALLDMLRRACVSLGWEDIGVDEQAGSVRAQVRSPLLGFTDDVEVRVEPVASGGARVELKSSSRVGRGDLGANVRHVLDLYGALEALIAAESRGA